MRAPAALRLERLAQMSLDEAAGRARLRARAWFERAGLARPRDLPALDQHLPALRARVRDGGGGRFFAGVADERVPAWAAAADPEARDQVLDAAARIEQGRFDLLGYRDVRFGDPGQPIDWHLDPVSGRRAPTVHWTRIDPLDATAIGDAKVQWELGRCQWLLPLGQAYAWTGEVRWARAIARALEQFTAANPPGVGIHWTSSLEVALRSISWCWTLMLARRSPVLDEPLFARALRALWAHGAHVERHLSRWFSPNTHLTGEALGLYYLGALFAGLPRARRWQALGARVLIDQCERQILADGVYFEQSTCYARYTAEIYLHFLILAARAGNDVPAGVPLRVQRLLDFLVACRRPDGGLPAIGDADGGALLPLAPRRPGDARAALAVAAALLFRADYARAAGGIAPEALWLLGGEAPRVWHALTGDEAEPPPPRSRLFPVGGYAILSGGTSPGAHEAIVDVGPLGCPTSSGHGHADLLALQLWAHGQPYVVDPGTYCYQIDRAWRDHFRSAAAHTTVTLDGEEPARPAGPFSWRERPVARIRRWLSTPALDFVDAEHAGYRRLADPVLHRRRVLLLRPDRFVVVDDLVGAAEHYVALGFQLAPRPATFDDQGWALVRGADGRGLRIRALARVPLYADLVEGSVDPIRGWVSADYGRRRPAPHLRFAAAARLPLRLITLLLPLADAGAAPPEVAGVFDRGGELVGVRWDGGRVLVDDARDPSVYLVPESAGPADPAPDPSTPARGPGAGNFNDG